MNRKRIVLGFIFILAALLCVHLQAADVVPLFSFRQIKVQKKRLKTYLNQLKRCLFTGPCTQQELDEIKPAIKLLSGAMVGGLFMWKGVPLIKELMKKQVRQLSLFAKKEILIQVKEILDDAENKDPEIAQLKREIKDLARKQVHDGFELLVNESKAGLNAARYSIGHGLLNTHDAWKDMIHEFEKLEKNGRGQLEQLIWSLPGEDPVVQLIIKWIKLSKEKLQELLKDKEVQVNIAKFMDKLGEESHILDFIKRLKEAGIDIDYFASETTKLGFPKMAIFKFRFGKKETDIKELMIGGDKKENVSNGSPKEKKK